MVEDEFSYPISINGKTKTNISISLSMDLAAVEAHIREHEDVKKYLAGAVIKKVIVVKGRIVNIVV
jgi:leucyl-tRNA synthetase